MTIFNWPFGQEAKNREYFLSQRKRMYRVAYSWCHNDALADDLVQEALLRAYKYGQKLRDIKALDGWLFRILKNCWHDELKRRREMQDIDTVPVFATDDTAGEYYQAELLQQVYSAMAKLPEAQREVVSLVDVAELSYEQVASALEIPVGTVMSRLNRARTSLRERLEKNCQETVATIIPFGVEHE